MTFSYNTLQKTLAGAIAVSILGMALVAGAAVPAYAEEFSWLNGVWDADMVASIEDRYPNLSADRKKSMLAKIKEEIGALTIDTKAKTISYERQGTRKTITITSLVPENADTARMETKDGEATGVLLWKRLADGKVSMIKPNGAAATYIRR